MISAIEKLKELNFDLITLINLRCSCHVLNLASKEGLKDLLLEQMLKKLRFFCKKKIHCSSKRKQDLVDKWKLNKEPILNVVFSIEIRWNTDFEICKTALKCKHLPQSTSTFSLNSLGYTCGIITWKYLFNRS